MTYQRIHVGRDHPLADSRGRVLAHRLAWHRAGNPPLARNEVLHHVDGSPSNNDVENLVVMDRAAHSRLHAQKRRAARRRQRLAGWVVSDGRIRFDAARRQEVLGGSR